MLSHGSRTDETEVVMQEMGCWVRNSSRKGLTGRDERTPVLGESSMRDMIRSKLRPAPGSAPIDDSPPVRPTSSFHSHQNRNVIEIAETHFDFRFLPNRQNHKSVESH